MTKGEEQRSQDLAAIRSVFIYPHPKEKTPIDVSFAILRSLHRIEEHLERLREMKEVQ